MGRYDEDYDDNERVVVIHKDQGGSSGLGMLLLGIAIGAGAALLYAPAAGDETRQRLRDEARRAGQKMRDMGDEFSEGLANRVERTREVVDRNLAAARDRVGSRVRGVSEAVEAGREAAMQARGELERAVSETKRAYADSRRNLRTRMDEGMNTRGSQGGGSMNDMNGMESSGMNESEGPTSEG
jgi:gas vesicle protein